MQICCSHQFLKILLYGMLDLVLCCYRFLPFLQPGRQNLKTQLCLYMWILVVVCFYILSEICRKIINPLLQSLHILRRKMNKFHISIVRLESMFKEDTVIYKNFCVESHIMHTIAGVMLYLHHTIDACSLS